MSAKPSVKIRGTQTVFNCARRNNQSVRKTFREFKTNFFAMLEIEFRVKCICWASNIPLSNIPNP
jgi:hypothetical protein